VSRHTGWRYHLTTLGSVLMLVSIFTLICAGLGLLAAGSQSARETVPAPGIWITPFPTPGPTP
jgi:hypothetical protein